MGWPCFWLERSGRVELGLRRYNRLHRRNGPGAWTCDGGWHEAFTWRNLPAPERYERGETGQVSLAAPDRVDRDDPCWPVQCDRGCGYAFTSDDAWQEWEEAVFRLRDGREVILHHGWPPLVNPGEPAIEVAAPGAMWDAWWLP